jgi:hypothetical protein
MLRGGSRSWSLSAELSRVGLGVELSMPISQWCTIKQWRLRMGAGRQAYLPSQGKGGSQSWSLGQRAAFTTELPHLAGGGADQTEMQLKGNTAATCRKQLWPPCMSRQPNLTSQLQLTLWTEGPLTRQSSGETTSELLLEHQYQDWTHKE